jgi:hypothetical protein
MRLLILHFNAIENYPPAMNLINYLGDSKNLSVDVCTTIPTPKTFKRYSNNNVRLYRFGRNSNNNLLRYFTYIFYNFMSFFILFLKRPDVVIIYETLSVFPSYIYKLLFPKKRIIFHYHEYISVNEYSHSSLYHKWLHQLERKLYPSAFWISHTNKTRLELFTVDYRDIIFGGNLKIMPNYPPLSFYRDSKKVLNDPIRFVYCGVLSKENMFLKEFSDYIVSQKGKAICDFYVLNCSKEMEKYFELSDKKLRLFSEISYFDLPEILSSYDVGVVLHKGEKLNYRYNLPNKVLEYLSAGLEVWCSDQLLTTVSFKNQNMLISLKIVDFKRLPEFGSITFAEKLDKKFILSHNAEATYFELFEALTK